MFRSAHADDVIAKVPTRSKRHRPRRPRLAIRQVNADRRPWRTFSEEAALSGRIAVASARGDMASAMPSAAANLETVAAGAA